MTPTLLVDYLLPPGHCYLCHAARRHPDEKIVDTGVMVDSPISANPNSPGFSVAYVEEPLVVCEACLTELGRAIGLAPAPDVEVVRVERDAAIAIAEQLGAEVVDLRSAIAALTRAGFRAQEPALAPVDEDLAEEDVAEALADLVKTTSPDTPAKTASNTTSATTSPGGARARNGSATGPTTRRSSPKP